jgi:hypothetical protein
MDSPIEYLNQLEADLEVLAEGKGGKDRGRGGGRARGGRWKTWSGAAAAFLVLAWGVGFFAESGMNDALIGAGPADEATSAARGDGEATAGFATPMPGAPDEAAKAALTWTVAGDATTLRRVVPEVNESTVDLSKIVRDGAISLEIENGRFEERFEDVKDIAKAAGGYVLASQTKGPGSGSLTLRIPASNFDDAFLAIRDLGTVTSSQVVGEDVTAEYVDLEARLTILEARRTVLLQLMTEATTIAQTLQVQNALDQVQLKIEQIEGQLRFLDNQVAESTLKVDLREKDLEEEMTPEEEEIANPSLSRAWDRAIQGFFGVMATVIVGLGYLVPLAALGGLGYGAVMLARRRRR